MGIRLWNGESASTEFFGVENAVEWSMLCAETKRELRSTKKLVARNRPAPRLVMGTNGDSFVPFVFLGAEPQILGDMTDEDARAEGLADLEAFKDHWMRCLGHAYFPVHERVMVYRFMRYHGEARTVEEVEALQQLAKTLYPTDLS